jgi:inhibitor of KinA sporulation pathway (predicted exonuclease)/transcription elongation factor Elf1
MNYIVLDLEFNGAYSKKKSCFVNEIIEFGAVKCDEQLNIIDNFSELVTPQISKKLNSHVKQLTRLKMSELQESNNTFTHVLSKFKKFLGDGMLLSWGTSDILVLMENCGYYLGEEKLPFLCAYANLQAYCEQALDYHDRSRQMGLSTCAELIGIGYDDGTLHRALTDAELTSLIFQKLYKAELFERYVQPCDEDFYKRITFKNYNLYDIKDPGVDRREFYFNCDCCGKRAWRRSRWTVKNKSFRARFRCIRCHRDFEGRLTFKQCYDSVEVFRRAVDLPLTKKTPAPENPAPAAEKPTEAAPVPVLTLDDAPRIKPVDEPLELY